MPGAKVGAPVRAADQSKRVQSWAPVAPRAPADARSTATLRANAIETAAERRRIEGSVSVESERRELIDVADDGRRRQPAAVAGFEAPDRAGAVIAVVVAAADD